MAVAKAPTTIASGVTASGTYPGTPVNTSTHNGDTYYGTITVVGTPSVGASIQVQESVDSTIFYSPPTSVFTAPTVAGVYPFKIAVDPAAAASQLVFSAQTGGTSSTLNSQLGSISE